MCAKKISVHSPWKKIFCKKNTTTNFSKKRKKNLKQKENCKKILKSEKTKKNHILRHRHIHPNTFPKNTFPSYSFNIYVNFDILICYNFISNV